MASGSPLRVDFSFSDSSYELAAIALGVDVIIDRTPVRFASAEDLIIHKMIASRPVDLQDVRSVLLKNAGMDLACIREWLAQFSDVLEQPLLTSSNARRDLDDDEVGKNGNRTRSRTYDVET